MYDKHVWEFSKVMQLQALELSELNFIAGTVSLFL